jgi:hypothetical protein
MAAKACPLERHVLARVIVPYVRPQDGKTSAILHLPVFHQSRALILVVVARCGFLWISVGRSQNTEQSPSRLALQFKTGRRKKLHTLDTDARACGETVLKIGAIALGQVCKSPILTVRLGDRFVRWIIIPASDDQIISQGIPHSTPSTKPKYPRLIRSILTGPVVPGVPLLAYRG